MKQEFFNSLQSTALFTGIAPENRQALIACLDPLVRSCQKGEIIVSAGESLYSIGIVLKGEVEILHQDAAGRQSLITFSAYGNTFGEVAAFAGHAVWPSTVIARTDCALAFIPPERFLSDCPKNCQFQKQLIQNMLQIISLKAMRLNHKVKYLEIKGIPQKLCTYLLEQRKLHGNDTFILPMKKNELADYLHVSRPSMSRELGRLRNAGLLDFYLSSVRLLDVGGLQKIASS